MPRTEGVSCVRDPVSRRAAPVENQRCNGPFCWRTPTGRTGSDNRPRPEAPEIATVGLPPSAGAIFVAALAFGHPAAVLGRAAEALDRQIHEPRCERGG
jgi:hypothetical protein